MQFEVLDSWGTYPSHSRNIVFLTWDNWNDYSFYTLFGIFYLSEDGQRHDLGSVRIGFFGQEENQQVYEVGYRFNHIGREYFSLGSEEYYEALNKLNHNIRDEILRGLNDIAKDPVIFDKVQNERVVLTSFYRSANPLTVTGQYRRMANGGARLTPYDFSFVQPGIANALPLDLSFDVVPDSLPPTNIHVLIGRNGVGKTYLINNMIRSLVREDIEDDPNGNFKFSQDPISGVSDGNFVNLIAVSFSAFDESSYRLRMLKLERGFTFSYIGLTQENTGTDGVTLIKDHIMLANEFYESLNVCKTEPLKSRWIKAIQTLQSDPNFIEAGIENLISLNSSKESRDTSIELFRRLSSGHKIILLSITRLIEMVQEKSLLILDEPEAHLHPPLLSSFIRALSDLLVTMNGVAIIATHSPVILQEVPKTCVWKLRRRGTDLRAERPVRETFGENVGVLTSDVFGLEVTDSGFYKMLEKIVEEKDYDFDEVIQSFDQQLGFEARSIIMALISNR